MRVTMQPSHSCYVLRDNDREVLQSYQTVCLEVIELPNGTVKTINEEIFKAGELVTTRTTQRHIYWYLQTRGYELSEFIPVKMG